MTDRQEFGFTRTVCDCKRCKLWCRHAPGALVPSDLARMVPAGMDPFVWAEEHLRVRLSPLGGLSPVSTLVPAKQANGHCHWLADGRCIVHADAPYGCAFHDEHMSNAEAERRSMASIHARVENAATNGLYFQIHQHLLAKGLVIESGRLGVVHEARKWLGNETRRSLRDQKKRQRRRKKGSRR